MKFKQLFLVKKPLLKKVFADLTIAVDAVNGKEIIPNAKDLFGSVDFETSNNWHSNAVELGIPTAKTQLNIFKVNRKVKSFREIFAAIHANPEINCSLTQHQILNFVMKYPNLLIKSGKKVGATMFLFTSFDTAYIATLHCYPDNSLGICTDKFETKDEFDPSRTNYYIVVPIYN